MLVDLPEGEIPGLAAYDLDKETDTNGFQPLRSGHVLANTKTVVRSAMNSTKLNAPNGAHMLLEYYENVRDKKHTRERLPTLIRTRQALRDRWVGDEEGN